MLSYREMNSQLSVHPSEIQRTARVNSGCQTRVCMASAAVLITGATPLHPLSVILVYLPSGMIHASSRALSLPQAFLLSYPSPLSMLEFMSITLCFTLWTHRKNNDSWLPLKSVSSWTSFDLWTGSLGTVLPRKDTLMAILVFTCLNQHFLRLLLTDSLSPNLNAFLT